MPFLPQRKISFPAYSRLSDTHCWKGLLGGLFSLTLSPEDETVVKVPTLTGKGKQHSNICSITFLCRRDPVTHVCLEISWKRGDTP